MYWTDGQHKQFRNETEKNYERETKEHVADITEEEFIYIYI